MNGTGTGGERETARFYTVSRRFPRMIGRLPEGTRLWGGPYTFSQLGVGAATFAVAAATCPLWSTGSIVIDLVILAMLSWGAALAARMLPTSRLNPAIVVATVIACAVSPADGVYRGRAARLPRTRGVRR